MGLKKISRLLKDPSSKKHVASIRQKFIEILMGRIDSENEQSEVYHRSVYIIKRLVRLPKLGLNNRELDIFLAKFRLFSGTSKEITTIGTICNILVEDQRSHRGSMYQCRIIRAALSFLRLNFVPNSSIHKSIGRLLDVAWSNIEAGDLKTRRAYISGNFELLTEKFRPFVGRTINRLKKDIILPIEKDKYVIPRSDLISKIIREFNATCQKWRASDSDKNFVYIFPLTQSLIEFFDQVPALEKTADLTLRLYEFCDIMYYMCAVSPRGHMIAFINPNNNLTSALAVLLLQGFSQLLLMKALFILEMIITNLSCWCTKWFCVNEDMKFEELLNHLLVKKAIDAIYQKDMDGLNEVLSKWNIVNLCDHRNQTLLQWAAAYGTPEIVELIYSKVSDNRKHDPTALMLALLSHRMDICRTLLQHRGVISGKDVEKILQSASKLTTQEREEVKTLLNAAKEESQIQLNGNNHSPQDDSSDPITPVIVQPQAGDESRSRNMMVYIFLAEMLPILIFVYNHSSIVAIRRIAIHQIRRLIRILPNRYMAFIGDIKFHGRYLCQWLCELINTSLGRDNELIMEESATLFNELLYKSPEFYHELSKKYDFASSLERFRSLQLFMHSQYLDITAFDRMEPFRVISGLVTTCHLRIHGWSFFRLDQYLIIHNEMAVVAIKANTWGKFTDGSVCTTEKGAELIIFSGSRVIKKYRGESYRLLCLVETVRRINPAKEIWKNQEIPERTDPQERPVSNALPPGTIQLWRSGEDVISMGRFGLESFRSENNEFYLHIKANDVNSLLLSESPNKALYFVVESPNEITTKLKQFRINDAYFVVLYGFGSLTKPLPHLQLINSPRERVLRTITTELKLNDIASELFNALRMENERDLLIHLRDGFKKLKTLLLNDLTIIAPNEVISSDIVRALLQCLSMSHALWNDHSSEMDQLNALLSRRKVFLSIFSHTRAFSKLVECIKTAFEAVEYLPLYLYTYLHSLRPASELFVKPEERAPRTAKGGIEGSIQFDVLRLLSYCLYSQRSSDKYNLYHPLFSWTIELKMADSSELIELVFKNLFSINQAQINDGPEAFTFWYGNSESIESFLSQFHSHPSTEIKINIPYIKWLSSSGGNMSTWIDAVYRGYIPAYSFLPNCQGVYHSGVDIPLLKSPSSGPCIVCKNKGGIRYHYRGIKTEGFFRNHQVGARYVIDLRAKFIPIAYCLTTLRNVDRNEEIENWCLQASNDGRIWTTLKVHKNERNLNSISPFFFKIHRPEFGFRLFRIMDLSPIRKQGRLHVCGLDFYGVVKALYRRPIELKELAQIPDLIRSNVPPQVPMVAEFYMTNLMKSIRDNEFHVPITGYSDTMYTLATGLKINSYSQASERVFLVIPPTLKDYRSLFGKIKSHLPVWRFQFELVLENRYGETVASYPIFDLKWPIFPYVVSLVEQVVLNKTDNGLLGSKLYMFIKTVSPEEKEQLKQEWLKRKGELLSDGDWYLVNQQREYLGTLPGTSSSKCLSKEAAEDMLKLIRLLYQLSKFTGDFREGDKRGCFISQHLTRKLERQFNDNLALMTGPSFPNWCFNLTQRMPFLFPFELRLRFFKACAFGPARSIVWLQENRRNPDAKFTDDHFYSYLPYTINSMFEELDLLNIGQVLKEIKALLVEVVGGQIVRHQTVISRNLTNHDNGEEFWKWAERVLEENADNMTRLSIFFSDEEGGGDGVTRDFYSTICQELYRKCNYMWLNDRPSENEDFISPSFGLFPTPYPRNTVPLTILRRFYTMGLCAGKALQEDQLLGLHLSQPFLKILCAYSKVLKYANTEYPLNCFENARNRTLSYEDIWIFGNHRHNEGTPPHWLTGVLGFDDFAELYPFHASTFRSLLRLARIHEKIRKDCENYEELEALLNDASLQYMGTTIESLGLSMEFTCTSSESWKTVKLKDLYPWELGETDVIDVDAVENNSIDNYNYVNYIRRTVEYCLNKGIQAQIDAFTRGFNQVLPLEWLSIFKSSELNTVLCGDILDVAWEKEELITFITTSDNLSKSSPLFEHFVEILVSLNAEERRKFLRWTTGRSALPSGGIKNLHPPLYVSKHQQGPYPQVYACFHALYLPEYCSASELRRSLLIAISQETFELI